MPGLRRFFGGHRHWPAVIGLLVVLGASGCDQTATEENGDGPMVNPDEPENAMPGDANRQPRDASRESE